MRVIIYNVRERPVQFSLFYFLFTLPPSSRSVCFSGSTPAGSFLVLRREGERIRPSLWVVKELHILFSFSGNRRPWSGGSRRRFFDGRGGPGRDRGGGRGSRVILKLVLRELRVCGWRRHRALHLRLLLLAKSKTTSRLGNDGCVIDFLGFCILLFELFLSNFQSFCVFVRSSFIYTYGIADSAFIPLWACDVGISCLSIYEDRYPLL